MSKEQEYLNFQVKRKVTALFKNIFFLLEDLQKENKDFSKEKYEHIRKRILDYGNDTIREIQTDINQFNIHI
jgi:uncharacterized protein YaaN involved in tellurite resistance